MPLLIGLVNRAKQIRLLIGLADRGIGLANTRKHLRLLIGSAKKEKDVRLLLAQRTKENMFRFRFSFRHSYYGPAKHMPLLIGLRV